MAAKQEQQTQELLLNSPRDFPTTQSFVTAQEELEPVPSGMEDADIDEVSSPNWKPIGRNTKRQVIQLHTDALQFKKSKTVHVKPRYQAADTNQAAETASGRAVRAQQRELRKAGVTAGWAQADTDASTALLALAQGPSDVLGHDQAQAEGGSAEPSQSDSQNSSSQQDRELAAAWARLQYADAELGTSDLAADWRTAAPSRDGKAVVQGSVISADSQQRLQHPAEHAEASRPAAEPAHASRPTAQPAQSPQPSASALATATAPAQATDPADTNAQSSQVPLSTSQQADSHPHGNLQQAAAPVPTAQHAQASDDAQVYEKPVTRAHVPVPGAQHVKSPADAQEKPITGGQAQTPKKGTRSMPTALRSPTTRSASKAAAAAERGSSPEQRHTAAQSPELARLKQAARQIHRASISPPQSPQQQQQQQRQQQDATQQASHAPKMPNPADALEAKALKLAMQRLVEGETRQRQADEALLHSIPPSDLLQVPLWSTSLLGDGHPSSGTKLQGTLTVPKQCSVRLLRRVFARALQVQPWCLELRVSSSSELVQDFEAGQEVLISRYRLQDEAEGLQVQLNLQQGCAQVQALIDQEVSLMKHQLIAARIASPPSAPAAGPSGQGKTPDRQRSVAGVLESAGWGATSPDKRVTPPQKPAQAASRHLADYEAMLPAQPRPTRTVPLVSPERRKVGKWSERETDMLIRKMEAGHGWARMRDEWVTLGFATRSAIDLKDKWRNLEDAVLKGKIMRGVQLTPEQKNRVLRCHRKYRSMLASDSDLPKRDKSVSQSPGTAAMSSGRQDHDRENSGENAPPTDVI